MSYDRSNEVFALAVDLVNQSSRNIFLTGKAGTGKTTFLKYIRDNCAKQMAIVAPTGVAAINAGGVTIHSFFQLPFSPFVPGNTRSSSSADEVLNRHSLLSRLRINSEKRKILSQLELLIIDEVSMVRCDILDAIDTVLRHVRKRPLERFGGVQLLLIGDMFQLPPVIKEREWSILSEFYGGPYFFDSLVIREEFPLYIEFDRIYRQSDAGFVELLNQVRCNELNETGLRVLEERYRPDFMPKEDEGYIILTTHNDVARRINANELANLKAPKFSYKADMEGDFAEGLYPADGILELKEGAQVMFIRNDTERVKRYFNGKIATVTELTVDTIKVRCKDASDEIEVKRERWENMRYTLNQSTRIMEEEVMGSFVQYPLRLAWAVTIHKSQGLTFEKAIIDAGEAFAPGQVYVALSRCTTLDGLILKSRIKPGSLTTDPRIVKFSKVNAAANQLADELTVSRKRYYENILLSTFDFSIAIEHAGELLQYVTGHSSSFNIETVPWIKEILDSIHSHQQVADKFCKWLTAQFQSTGDVNADNNVRQRTCRAALHFIDALDGVRDTLRNSPAITDSRLQAQEYNEGLREIYNELSLKTFLLEGFKDEFDPHSWHLRRKNFVLPSFHVNAYAGSANGRTNSPHPALYGKLRKLRDAFCAPKDLPIYLVASSRTLDEMVRYLPQTLEDLEKMHGFGEAKIKAYGQDFLDVIIEYCHEHELDSMMNEWDSENGKKKVARRKSPKGQTKSRTFDLYKKGMTVTEIAVERKLTRSTIQQHLAYFVSMGDIDIRELVSQEKIIQIESAIRDYDGTALTPIKQKLGSDIEYADIRLVLAWQQHQKANRS